MLIEPPESVKPLFAAAGWHPARRVTVPSSIPVGHPANRILALFGGLTITPARMSGEECATDDLAFQELEPDESVTGVWGGLLGTRLIGIAEMHLGHGELYVSTDGRYFGRSLIHDAFYFEGASFSETMERSLLGRRSRPMLRPDQSSVTLYGIQYTADSAEVYRYG